MPNRWGSQAELFSFPTFLQAAGGHRGEEEGVVVSPVILQINMLARSTKTGVHHENVHRIARDALKFYE